MSGIAQPTGFADMVDRVKPSVISVKVTMKEKVVDADSKDATTAPTRPWSVSFVSSAARRARRKILVVTGGMAK